MGSKKRWLPVEAVGTIAAPFVGSRMFRYASGNRFALDILLENHRAPCFEPTDPIAVTPNLSRPFKSCIEIFRIAGVKKFQKQFLLNQGHRCTEHKNFIFEKRIGMKANFEAG